MSATRPATRRQPQRTNQRSLAGPAVIAGVAALLIGLAVWSSRGGGPDELGTAYANQGQEHIAEGASHAAYNSFPATSGPHVAAPQPWGVFGDEIAEEKLVHNLEHGGIVIQYNPSLYEGSLDPLIALQAKYPNKTVVAPNSRLTTAFALTAWKRLYTLDTLDEVNMTAFIDRYKNKAPERMPD
ncbi:DUF3105 domain-containing protein [Deinococcus ficus]|uniref:DUF3105 domain-containing protein n=1 Tax=Deinococcus ficus TaxID=317577 RepID=UPI0003B2E4DA|nr:DUF3105 domain-containing protein [Deinococcus ficus]